jgi:surface carbohydrate biosynthesis protein
LKKKTVLFPIEIKARELNSKILLSLQCAKRGMRTYIGSKTSINRLYPKLESGIFFYKSGDRAERIENIKKYCSHFIVMDEEVGPAIPNEFICKTLKNRMRKDAIPIIDKFFVIGKKYKGCAQKVYNKSEKDVIASGWPRIDLWRQEFLQIYSKKAEEIKSKYGEYILLSSNFGVTSEKSLELWKKHVDENIRWDSTYKKYLKNRMVLQNESFLRYVGFLKEISRIRPDIKFIVRPHPSDDFKGWYEGIGDLSNIEIIYKGEISPWIYASKCLLHYGCTSAVQAEMAGIPSITYKKPKGKIGDRTSFDISHEVNDVDEFLRFVDNIAERDNDKISKKLIKKIEENISSIEGKMASDKIATILSNLESLEAEEGVFSLVDRLVLDFKHIGLRLILFKNKIFGGKETSPRSQKIPGGIAEDEVKKFALKAAKILNLDPKRITCKKINRDLFKIEYD